MLDKSFSAKLSLTFTGDDSGKVWDEVSYSNNGLDADELQKYCVAAIPGITQLMLGIGAQLLNDGVDSGAVAKPST